MRRNSKLAVIIAVLLSVSCLMNGCDHFGHIDSDIEGEKLSLKLLQYLNENDSDSLKNMFCERTRNSPDFYQEIEDVLEFFEGEVTSHDSLVGKTSDSKSMDNGKITRLYIVPDITSVETDEGKTYEIWFHTYLVNADHPDLVGIMQIVVVSADGERISAGEFYE